MVDPAMLSQEVAMATNQLSNDVGPTYDIPSDAALILLWFMFATMFVGSFVFAASSWRVPTHKRVYHYVATTVTTISTLAYFSMATYSVALLHHAGEVLPPRAAIEVYARLMHQHYWTRYLDWSLTIPLILVMLSLVAGIDATSIFAVVVSAVIMILTGFLGMNSRGKVVLGWFSFAVLAYLLLVHQVLLCGRSQARKRGPAISRFYTSISVYTLAVLLGYLVIWMITSHGTVLGIDGQIGAYAVLDVLFKGVFGAWLLYTYAKVPELGTALSVEDTVDEGRIRVGEE